MKINKHFLDIQQSYLFSTVAKKVNAYTAANPDKKIIRLGIGDVTRPLVPAVIEAMHGAVDDMSRPETFKGYGDEQGYGFLREAIQKYYAGYGASVEQNEIFISDGAKSDIGNILDLFDQDNLVLITDPVYPVYMDTNVMAGRKIVTANANESNGFLPMPDPAVKADIIYICSPNNPTGAAYNHEQLKVWVDYARANHAVILFDAAYEAFIVDKDVPHSIFEIEGAKECAIEFCSFSKTAGFTGTRCGYTVVPANLEFDGGNLNKMWLRRQTTKYNGTAYVIQKAASAVFTPEGFEQTRANIAYYRENAAIMMRTLDEMGIWYTGGKNSPYIWLKCPSGMGSWEFFDALLEKCNIVGTPGAGFGANGEGFFRLTSFNTHELTAEAMERFKKF